MTFHALEQSAVRLERQLSRELLRFAEVDGDRLHATVVPRRCARYLNRGYVEADAARERVLGPA
jgi:hypothetical protein